MGEFALIAFGHLPAEQADRRFGRNFRTSSVEIDQRHRIHVEQAAQQRQAVIELGEIALAQIEGVEKLHSASGTARGLKPNYGIGTSRPRFLQFPPGLI